MMKLEIRSNYYPKPFEPSHYIRSHEVSIVCTCEDEDVGLVVAGRIAVDYLDITRAEIEGQNILHVCDSDSQGWLEVYAATIEPADDFAEIRKDFHFDDPVHGLVFVHRVVMHPCLNDWRRMILDSVFSLFPMETATVMWRGATDLGDKDLASLGFRIIAGHDLLFRPNMRPADYDSCLDNREPLFDLKAPSDAEEYVESHWDLDDDPYLDD